MSCGFYFFYLTKKSLTEISFSTLVGCAFLTWMEQEHNVLTSVKINVGSKFRHLQNNNIMYSINNRNLF